MAHYLIVEDLFSEEEPFDRWIEHEENCITIVRDYDPLTGLEWDEWLCGVGQWEENYGCMDLEDDVRYNTPGKWEIDFYHYWSGSAFDDSEAYLYFVEKENPCKDLI